MVLVIYLVLAVALIAVKVMVGKSLKDQNFVTEIVPNFYSKGVIKNREKYWKNYPKLKTSNPDPIIVKRVKWQKKSNEYTS